MTMFFTIVILIWTALNGYVFWRVASIPLVARRVPRWVIIVLAVLLWAAFPLSHAIETVRGGIAAQGIGLVGSYWLGSVFLLFVTTLVADLLTGFGLAFRKRAPLIRSHAIALGCILSLIAIVQGLRAPVVDDYEIRVANLPLELDGTVVVVASDIHLGGLTTTSWFSGIVDQINAQQPDVIVLAGDVVEGHGDRASKFSPSLRRLSAKYGVWAVNGNHEGYGGNSPGSHEDLFKDASIHVLHNEWAQIAPGLVISGVDDLTSRYRRNRNAAELVERALAAHPEGASIFISHTPWFADKAAALGAGVMISGHTHNGQIWPFNYIVQLTYPLMSGRYDVGGMPVLVCRGTGTWGPRMRLWQRSEILRVRLHPLQDRL